MVVICFPSAALTGSEQERTASPSTCTVHAPHWAIPQPYLVPVRPTFSRITHNNGVSGSTSTLWDCPLMVRRAMVVLIACLISHRSMSVLAGSILAPGCLENGLLCGRTITPV